LPTTSRWPLVMGSNDPANSAVRGISDLVPYRSG
jgi:hypothetical protein